MRKITSAKAAAMNRRVWDATVMMWKEWTESTGLTPDFYRRGGFSFDSVDLHPFLQATPANRRKVDRMVASVAGPVRGKRVLDLQCGMGEGALSWARLGGRVTGVDQSGKRLEIARRKAADARLAVEYVRANVLRLPFRSRKFDLVFTSGGVLTWLPDIRKWGREAARVLKPGGRLVILEYHPFLNMLGWKKGVPSLKNDYFNQGPIVYHNGKRIGDQVEHNWKVSDVVGALLDAGLSLTRMVELPAMGSRRVVFPHRLLLVFRKGKNC